MISLSLFASCNDDDTTDTIDDGEPYVWVRTHSIASLFEAFGNTEITVDTVAIVGTVVSSDEEGNISNKLYIEDETGAVELSLTGENLFESFPFGDQVLVKCVGLQPFTEGFKLQNPDGSAITLTEEEEIFLTGDQGSSTTADFIRIEDLSDQLINQYLRIGGFQFDEAAINQTLGSQARWELTNADGESIFIKLDANSSFANTQIPDQAGLVYG
ncbi:MAG: DUF5689 domain-containing protein, partial [Bacteroidota bacterium]